MGFPFALPGADNPRGTLPWSAAGFQMPQSKSSRRDLPGGCSCQGPGFTGSARGRGGLRWTRFAMAEGHLETVGSVFGLPHPLTGGGRFQSMARTPDVVVVQALKPAPLLGAYHFCLPPGVRHKSRLGLSGFGLPARIRPPSDLG